MIKEYLFSFIFYLFISQYVQYKAAGMNTIQCCFTAIMYSSNADTDLLLTLKWDQTRN
jgi:hypothetical protein